VETNAPGRVRGTSVDANWEKNKKLEKWEEKR
jgi:hypothetical protein